MSEKKRQKAHTVAGVPESGRDAGTQRPVRNAHFVGLGCVVCGTRVHDSGQGACASMPDATPVSSNSCSPKGSCSQGIEQLTNGGSFIHLAEYKFII